MNTAFIPRSLTMPNGWCLFPLTFHVLSEEPSSTPIQQLLKNKDNDFKPFSGGPSTCCSYFECSKVKCSVGGCTAPAPLALYVNVQHIFRKRFAWPRNSGREQMMHEYTSRVRTWKRFWRKEGKRAERTGKRRVALASTRTFVSQLN
jgi:hypothetical protein